MDLGDLTLEEAARAAAGNWQHFHCFWWHRIIDLDAPQDWCIVYTKNRDSGLLDQSNSAAVAKTLTPFLDSDDPDVVPEHHAHFACGWIAGYSIRVYRNGEITSAFRTYHEIAVQLADYPVLDEETYSERELEATLANIADAAWKVKHEFNLPDDWEIEVYRWLSDRDPAAVENRDDQGGYPSEDQLRGAFDGLGYEKLALA